MMYCVTTFPLTRTSSAVRHVPSVVLNHISLQTSGLLFLRQFLLVESYTQFKGVVSHELIDPAPEWEWVMFL